MTITKTFNYRGEMINYIKKIQQIRKVTSFTTSLDQRTKKYTLTYTF